METTQTPYLFIFYFRHHHPDFLNNNSLLFIYRHFPRIGHRSEKLTFTTSQRRSQKKSLVIATSEPSTISGHLVVNYLYPSFNLLHPWSRQQLFHIILRHLQEKRKAKNISKLPTLSCFGLELRNTTWPQREYAKLHTKPATLFISLAKLGPIL